MTVRWQGLFLALIALFLSPLLGEVKAQPNGKWWTPIGPTRGQGPSAHTRPGPLIPKGHRPPSGMCRLWQPGRPPGKQPPPMSCREAYLRQRGQSYVVTHRGAVRGGPPSGWYRHPAEDFELRRPPRTERDGFGVNVIIDVLGRRGYRRLRAQNRRLGASGTLKARWVSIGPSGGGVLQVRVGPHPLAELVDRNGDGRLESALFWRDR